MSWKEADFGRAQQTTTNPAGSNQRTHNMKMRLEQLLHFGAAVVTLAAAFGLAPMAVALLSAAISVDLAVSAGLPH